MYILLDITVGIQNKMNLFLTTEEVEKIEKFELKNLNHKFISIKNINHRYIKHLDAILVEAIPIKYEQLYPFECKLLVDTFGPKIYELNFETSYKAFFNNKCKYH